MTEEGLTDAKKAHVKKRQVQLMDSIVQWVFDENKKWNKNKNIEVLIDVGNQDKKFKCCSISCNSLIAKMMIVDKFN